MENIIIIYEHEIHLRHNIPRIKNKYRHYYVGEYCSIVWINSNKIDTQLNDSKRMVSCLVKSTPLQWLPSPPPLQRKATLKRALQKCFNNTPTSTKQQRLRSLH